MQSSCGVCIRFSVGGNPVSHPPKATMIHTPETGTGASQPDADSLFDMGGNAADGGEFSTLGAPCL